jgi:flagellar biosynthesis/type III secretory pathway protein FliH
MRSHYSPSDVDRPWFESRVRFSGRLVNAAIVSLEDAHVTKPAARVAPGPPPTPSTAPLTVPTPAAQPPADFWKSDVARELKADRARIEEVLGKVQAAATELRKDQTERLREWQRAAVELAMTIATRLLHEKVNSGDFPMDTKVRDMVARLEEDAPVAIRLNPMDVELLESCLNGEPLLPGRDEQPRLVPDSSLGRGDCRVEGKEAMLLSDIRRELEEIRDELLRSLAHARS